MTKVLAKAGESTKDLDASLKRLGNTPLGVEATKSANNLNDALKRVTDQQQKLGQQATFAATGIEKLGGPARLTTDQLNQMNVTIQKGLDAFRALGQEAPAELQRVAAAVKAQQQALEGSGSAITKITSLQGALTSQLAAYAGPAAIGFAIKQTLDYADTLTKMSDRTGIGVIALQRLEAIAKPSGNTIEEVANAVNKFQKNLAEGDSAATGAINRLGLSFSKLKDLNPDEQFIAIAKAIQGIKDPAEQTLIAVQLFGRGGAEILPTLKAKVDELADSTVKMSAESVKALDDLGDKFGQLKTSALNSLGELVAEAAHVIEVYKNLPGAISKAIEDIRKGRESKIPFEGAARTAAGLLGINGVDQLFDQVNAQASPGIPKATGPTSDRNLSATLPTNIEAITAGLTNSAQALIAIGQQQKAVADSLGLSLEEYQKKLGEVNDKIRLLTATSSGLNDAQKIQATSLAALGLSEEDIALKLGTSAKAVKDYFEAVKAGASAEVEFLRQLDAQAKLQRDAEIATIALSLAIREHLLPNTVALKDQLAAVGTQTVRFDGENEAAAVHLKALGTDVENLGQKLFASNFEIKKGHDGYAQWEKDLSQLSTAFSELANISGGTFGGIVKDIGGIISAFNTAVKAAEAFKTATTGAEKAVALAAGAAAIASATDPQQHSRASGIIGGALTGQQIGAATSIPFGGLIGGIIGGLVGVFRGIGAPSQQQLDARDQQSSLLKNLRGSLGDEGSAVDKVAGAFGHLFDKPKLSDWDVVLKTIGKDMADLGYNGDQTLQVVSGLFDTEHPERYAAAVKAANDVLQREANIVPSVVKGFGDLNALTAKGVSDQGQFNVESRSAIALFDQYLKKTGDLAGGLAQLKPTFDALRKGETDFGLAGSAALEKLLHLSDVAAANQPLVDQISQTTALLKDLAGAAVLTKDDFEAFGEDAYNQFVNLTAATGDQKTALLLMQPELQALWEQAQIFGDITDSNTKALIDQAVQQGIVGAQQEDVNHKMLDVLEAINEVLGGKIPDSLKKLPGAAASAASGVETELQKIKAPDLTIKVGFDDGGGYNPTDQFTNSGYGSTGGYVTSRGIQHFAGGGRVLPFWSRGSDTVPAMLTPGEMVLTAAQQKNISDNLGGSLQVDVNIHSVVAPTGAQMRMAADAFVPALKDAIFRDVAGVRKIIKKAAA